MVIPTEYGALADKIVENPMLNAEVTRLDGCDRDDAAVIPSVFQQLIPIIDGGRSCCRFSPAPGSSRSMTLVEFRPTPPNR